MEKETEIEHDMERGFIHYFMGIGVSKAGVPYWRVPVIKIIVNCGV